MEVAEALDPNYQMIVGRFGRENTCLVDGQYIKDLSYLNRPMTDVVYVDFSDETVKYQPDNCIILPKFEGDSNDRELIDLIPFLERKCIFYFYLTWFFQTSQNTQAMYVKKSQDSVEKAVPKNTTSLNCRKCNLFSNRGVLESEECSRQELPLGLAYDQCPICLSENNELDYFKVK